MNWRRAKNIFNSALELAPELRGKYVADACGGDDELNRQVNELLNSYDTNFLEPVTYDDNPKFSTGDRLGRYEVVRLLGVGGMGEVYLAHDGDLNRNVAIKVFTAEAASSGDRLERFIREARAASALNHPHICTIYEINKGNDPPFIAMEFIEGETLAERINSGIGTDTAVEIALQIAEGLKEAHEAGIVHRDIKPANIIIDKRGQVKVVDFGLAKKLSSASEDSTQRQLSRAGMIMGTVSYMSPEQVRGERLDPRSDIFSFGVLVYEMIAGRRPFLGDSMAETMSLILTAEPAPLAQGSPPVLEQLIKKCLEKDSSRRYQSMKKVIPDLKNLDHEYSGKGPGGLRTEPTLKITPAPTGTESTIAKWKGVTPRRTVVVLAAVIVFVTIGYVLLVRNPNPSSDPTHTFSRSPAYELYVRGKVKVASVNSDDNKAAVNMLEQAVAIDPNYAEAWAELAKGYVFRSFNFAPDSEQRRLNEDAEVAVEKALELNPNLAEGHLARGLVLWTHAKRFPHEQAIQAFKRAIALKPDLDEAHQWLSAVYIHIGLFDMANQEINRTLEINPNNPTVRLRMIAVNTYQGKYEDAIAVFKTTPPDMYPANLNRITADSLVHLGRLKEADAIVEEYLKTYPQDEGGNVTSVKAILLAKTGKEKEAEEAIQRAIEIGRGFGHFHHTAYNIASAYAIMNRPEDAVRWLQAAADDGFPCYPYFEIDSNLDPIRKGPMFTRFMTDLKAQYDKYRREFH